MTNQNFVVYCDLDGVLVDFERGIVETGNALLSPFKTDDFDLTLTLENFGSKYEYDQYKLIKNVYNQFDGWKDQYTFDDFKRREKGDKAFRNLLYTYIARSRNWWIDLEWMPAGKMIWQELQQYSPLILSSPVGRISAQGKKIWCERELGLTRDKMIIVDDKGIDVDHKIILFDDREKSIKQVEAVGGIGILYIPGEENKCLETLHETIRIL